MSREVAAAPLKGLYARIITMGVLGSYALIVVVGALLWQLGQTRSILSGPVLLTVSLLASVMCFGAWRRL